MRIELAGVSFVYLRETPMAQTALKNISLQIGDGEFVSVIGPTGSGKSTLVQLFNGLLQPTQGKILVDGQEIGTNPASLRALRQRVGLVFQFPEHQLFEERVYDDVAFGPRNLGCSEAAVRERVQDSLQMVGLDYEFFKSRSPFALSGGEMRRVAIAGVLAMEPEILVLDEPTSGLDPVGRVEIMSRLDHLHRQKNLTIVLVSHNMDEVSHFSKRLIVLDKGRLVLEGTPKQVFVQPDRLLQIGLDIPQITTLLRRLKAKGLDVPVDVFKIVEAEQAILSCLRGK